SSSKSSKSSSSSSSSSSSDSSSSGSTLVTRRLAPHSSQLNGSPSSRSSSSTSMTASHCGQVTIFESSKKLRRPSFLAETGGGMQSQSKLFFSHPASCCGRNKTLQTQVHEEL